MFSRQNKNYIWSALVGTAAIASGVSHNVSDSINLEAAGDDKQVTTHYIKYSSFQINSKKHFLISGSWQRLPFVMSKGVK